MTKLQKDIKLDPRPEYQRAKLSWQPDDDIPVAISTGSQCSSRLLSMRTANILLQLPARSDSLTHLKKNTIVTGLVIGAI